ncbi:hypothetical protein BKA56DRAFT_609241 [Ilyonectria sp. MPI-CAGE-AT-0026]|nr:hypothetical protein BKA56DRAFT_609241 [Ilyonectria sp. MPI-CAGE-AT-0026]
MPSIFSRQAMAYTSSVYILVAASALIESGWFPSFVPGQPSGDSQYPEANAMVCMAQHPAVPGKSTADADLCPARRVGPPAAWSVGRSATHSPGKRLERRLLDGTEGMEPAVEAGANGQSFSRGGMDAT